MDTAKYLHDCLNKALEMKGQDLFLKIGSAPRTRVAGTVTPVALDKVNDKHIDGIINNLMNPVQREWLQKNKSADFAFTLTGSTQRFRGNIFLQQGQYSVVLRTLWKTIPTFEELKLPPILKKIALERSGIILIGGPVSSGKSTTMTAMIDAINENEKRHILTIEDPVEYVHQDKKSIINQREIGQDADDFNHALRYVVRQSPDVVVIGEMRDADTLNFAISASEVGRLVIATVHGRTVLQMIDRVLGFYPPNERDKILGQLYSNITCFAAQRLLVQKDGCSLIPAIEVLIGNYTTRQLVHEKRFDRLDQAMRNGVQDGMQTMDQAITQLWEKGLITPQAALENAERPQELENFMKGIKIDGRSGKILGT